MSEYLDRSMDIGEFVPQPDDDIIICRCEEITKGEIRRAVHLGFWTLTEIKRATRVGMGMCQGSTCQRSVKAIVAKELGMSQNQLEDNIARPPMRAIKFGAYGEEVEKK